MSRTFIYSYNEHSEGAKLLAREMGIKRIKHEGSRFRPSDRKKVINWGCGNLNLFNLLGNNIINIPQSVRVCTNKLAFFQSMTTDITDIEDGIEFPRVPDWTTEKSVAQEWNAFGSTVVARTILSGHSGVGMYLIEPNASPEAFVEAPLYTRYVKKMSEFRVHIVNGVVIDVQKKMKRLDFEGERDTRVRNLANGYIFAREDIEVPEDVKIQSLRAMACSGLDFGAVDIIFNQREGQAYVLEINTAPGLCGTTLINYANALKDL